MSVEITMFPTITRLGKYPGGQDLSGNLPNLGEFNQSGEGKWIREVMDQLYKDLQVAQST